jgi:TadE-like protein
MTFCRRTFARLRSLRAHEAGSQAIELALTLPVFLVLFFGVIECGRLLFTYAALNFAAEEATRYAIVNYEASITDIEREAKKRLILIDLSKIIIDVPPLEPDPVDQTKLVSVEIAYTFQPILPIGLGSFTMTGHSRGFRFDQ